MYQRARSPTEDSDQTEHSRSQIKKFTGRILDIFFFFIRKTKNLIRLLGCSGRVEFSFGIQIGRYIVAEKYMGMKYEVTNGNR